MSNVANRVSAGPSIMEWMAEHYVPAGRVRGTVLLQYATIILCCMPRSK